MPNVACRDGHCVQPENLNTTYPPDPARYSAMVDLGLERQVCAV